ncbi:hypothetical protein SPRG_20082 [Saprolegnia parasitica CBS 223.65]|uniref:Uncharacterized protein n=1 Tax=Saprolegnia parasitica (strain CBS 223.65) TaxID=695850 RepID=A0A067CDY3_SAPPC|nr:hypothetical protein SPRG_20082 [Saprolegnia parasitica CBS 223.65]KDO28979.1 hypothetical protein SPRG_20082 [Saprolegnia parasitica CBS 223.65]|eukprot:XP_012200312.1 hypothetical protein SPRG_20082 [Saprolegnia parasitica CBS 223.65]
MASFRNVFQQPELAAIVFKYQSGIYEDVRSAFRAFKNHVRFHDGTYIIDPRFVEAVGDLVPTDARLIEASDYVLPANQRDRRFLLHVAIARDLMDWVLRLLRCRPVLASGDAILVALGCNRLEIAEALLDMRPSVPLLNRTKKRRHGYLMAVFERIIAIENVRGLQLLARFGLCRKDFWSTADDVIAAVLRGNAANIPTILELLPWLACPRLFDAAAGKGLLQVVQHLHNGGVGCSSRAMDGAATNGHLDVVEFLHTHRREGCTWAAMDNAAGNGHLDVVSFLYRNRAEGCTIEALHGAISNGALDVIDFLLAQRSDGASPYAIDEAASCGQLQVVMHLHTTGTFGATVRALDEAILHGHLDVVQFLLENRSEGSSHDDLVRYALECVQPAIAEFLIARGYPFPNAVTVRGNALMSSVNATETVNSVDATATIIETIQHLVKLGVPWSSDWMDAACASHRHFPLVKYLQDHSSAGCTTKALDGAAKAGAWDIVEFLLQHRLEGGSIEAVAAAIEANNMDMVAQLLMRTPALRGDPGFLWSAMQWNRVEVLPYFDIDIRAAKKLLVSLVGFPNHATFSKALLPHTMHPDHPRINLEYLLGLFPDTVDNGRRMVRHDLAREVARDLARQLELQGRKLLDGLPRAPGALLARADELRGRGAIRDWAIAVFLEHWSEGVRLGTLIVRINRVQFWLSKVQDDELRTMLEQQLFM